MQKMQEKRISKKTKRGKEISRNYKKRWRERNPERVYEMTIKYRKKYPERARARDAVKRAIRDGKIKRMPCEICGNNKSQAYHKSYDRDKWLDVQWYCPSFHALIEGKTKTK
jgi:hypothetical protein